MMNAFRGRHVVHLPTLAETVAEVQILAWRTAREERCKTANRFEGLTPQGTGSAADPLAAYWLLCVRWESIRESSSYQAARFEAFHATMHDCTVNAPKQSRRSERLISQVAHRCAYVWISPNRLEEFLGPVSVNLHIVVDQEKVVVLCTLDSKVALLGTVSFRMMKVADIHSCFTPASLVRQRQSFCVISAMHYNYFRNADRLFGETLEAES